MDSTVIREAKKVALSNSTNKDFEIEVEADPRISSGALRFKGMNHMVSHVGRRFKELDGDLYRLNDEFPALCFPELRFAGEYARLTE